MDSQAIKAITLKLLTVGSFIAAVLIFAADALGAHIGPLWGFAALSGGLLLDKL